MRFIVALVLSKIMLFIYKLIGKTKDDKPGLLANKICPDFLSRIKKPKLVICVSGTNGKTSIVNFLADIFKEQGYKVSYNDWGANIFAGHSRVLLDTVNIFNRSTKDVAIIEVDEKTSYRSIPMIKPNYFIVTNLFRDSIRRNGHIEFIYNNLSKAFLNSPDTIAILNANDPISSNLASKNKRIYVGINDVELNPKENNSAEYLMCPKCGAKPKYDYKLYRSIGGFHCDCGYKYPDSKYTIDKIDFKNKTMLVNGEEYKLVNDSIFYAYNILFVIALLKELKIKDIKKYIDNLKITSFRNMKEIVNGKEVELFACKGQNGSSSSSVFEYLTQNKEDKELIILMDELHDKYHPLETLTWIYEADFEFLNSPNIKKIIVGGKMYRNYKVRLKLAGIPEDKIVCVENELDTIKYLNMKNKDKVYILFDVDIRGKAIELLDKLKEEYHENN